MNKTKIEWCDYTWNVVRGCLHGCDYCYGKRIDKRFGDGTFAPTFYPARLQEPLKVKKPARIFVGSMADLFGEWTWRFKEGGFTTTDYAVKCILRVVSQCPQHTFIFLTKNPKGMQTFFFPDNCWCGTSVEDQEKADLRIPELLKVQCRTRFVSYEPALGPVDFYSDALGDPLCRCAGCLSMAEDYPDSPGLQRIDWLIIGAQTGPGAVKPNPEWINSAVKQAVCAGVPLFVKDNVHYSEQIREFPGVRG